MVQLQRVHLSDRDTWQTAETWARGLIEQPLRITHYQWLHRNSLMHYRLADGRTYAKRERLIKRVQELMWTDPDDLLPIDRSLLDEDFEKLGAADAGAQAYWAAEVEAALKVAQHEHEPERARRSRGDSPYVEPQAPRQTPAPSSHAKSYPAIDTKGSIRY